MAAIQNARDILLQGVDPRIEIIDLPANILIPAEILIDGVPASDIAQAATNFNAANDRNSSAILPVAIDTNGSAIDHTLQSDGSADISFEWIWGGDEGTIDGFQIYVYQSASSAAYAIGTIPALETVYVVPAHKRAFILFGVAPTKYYTFGIKAYRAVDKDIDATGVISSPLTQPLRIDENPYRPSSVAAFSGNITGTVGSVSTDNVNVWSEISGAGKPEDDATKGAPVGTLVAGVDAAVIATAATNYNASNDLKTTTPATPSFFGGISFNSVLDYTTNSNGTVDISFEWLFTAYNGSNGDDKDIDGFFVYVYNHGTSAPLSPINLAIYPAQLYTVNALKRVIILAGMSPDSYYTFGVQAYRSVDTSVSKSGLLVSPIAQPTTGTTGEYVNGAWRASSSLAFHGDIFGTIEGVPAVTVVSNSVNGQLAYSGTEQYRTVGAPTNPPAPTGITLITNVNGTVNIRLDWGYTQGTRPADMILLFWRKDGYAPTINDSSIAFNVNTSNSYYIFEGINPADTYSFGIAAARKTENGLEIGPVIAPVSSPGWRGVTGGTPNYTANINGMAASSLTAAATNYIASNDLKTATPAKPTFTTLSQVLDYTTNRNGTVDISFEWLFTAYNGSNGDDKDIDGFFIYVYNNGTSPPVSSVNLTTVPVQLFTVDSSKRSIVLTGMSPDSYYTFGVQAYRSVDTSVSKSGLLVSQIAQPTIGTTGEYVNGAWRATSSVAFEGDIIGTIDGEPAASVVTKATDGSTAYAGTANYRNASAPTNNAVFGAITQSQTADGNIVVEVPYTYTQGTVLADQIFIYFKESGGTVTAADPCAAVNAVSGSMKFTLKPSTIYRFGLQAVRRTENGLVGTSILQGSNMTTSASNFTGSINSVPASTISLAATNFNASNDRNGSAISAPTISGSGTAVDHTISDDGSADISFEWSWGGTEGDIDGFLIYIYQSASASSYTFGTSAALETIYTVPANKRAFILYGVPANKYYTFGVQAYRSVDKDINSSGIIKSTLVKPGLSSENPYRPSANIAFAGNVIGTIAGIDAADVNDWAAISGPGKPADNATKNTGIFANLDGQIDQANYKTYVAANSFSILGFSQNQTTQPVLISTSVSVNSDGQPVVIIFSARVSSATNGAPGQVILYLQLKVNGVQVYYDQGARLSNPPAGGGNYQQVTTSVPILINSPGSGSVTYSLTATATPTDGTALGQLVAWPTIQVIGLKR